jgi:flavin reductase (DIM6/NTAB) family NADH-FMN oxidoreductase RutF
VSDLDLIGPDEYRAILSRFASGVTVVTARSAEEIAGMTVSAFCAVSMEPPLVLVSLSSDRPTTNLIEGTGWYGVNVLAADQAWLSERFAFADPSERFDGVDWTPGPHGSPMLAGTIGSIECRVVRTVEAGDHQVIIGEVMHAATSDGLPIVYTQRGYHELGESFEL